MSEPIRPSRYYTATQHDGRGQMIFRLNDICAGHPATATVVAVDLSEADAARRLADLRATEVDESLREAGDDPDAIGKRGTALVAGLLAKRKERSS